MLNCFDKTFTFIDDNGNDIKVKGVLRKVTLREIFALKMKRSVRKICKVFVFYIMNGKENGNKLQLSDIPVLKEFEDIFSEEVPRIYLKRDIDFTINLIPRVVPIVKAPY